MTSGKVPAIFGGALAALLLAGIAEGQEGETPDIVMVEIFGCTFNDGNGMGDLMAVTERWNAWADEREVDDYEASILTPYLYSPAFPYQVLWLGVYPNAEAMGAGQAVWLAEGSDMNTEFGEVVTCSVHGLFAGLAAHIPAVPPEPGAAEESLIAFQDCSLHAERTIPEAMAAHAQWGDYLAEQGTDNFMGAIVPIAGEDPDAGYDYKAVVAFETAEAWGQFLGTVIPGGLQRANQLFGRLTDCDTSRVYQSVQVRAPAQDN